MYSSIILLSIYTVFFITFGNTLVIDTYDDSTPQQLFQVGIGNNFKLYTDTNILGGERNMTISLPVNGFSSITTNGQRCNFGWNAGSYGTNCVKYNLNGFDIYNGLYNAFSVDLISSDGIPNTIQFNVTIIDSNDNFDSFFVEFENTFDLQTFHIPFIQSNINLNDITSVELCVETFTSSIDIGFNNFKLINMLNTSKNINRIFDLQGQVTNEIRNYHTVEYNFNLNNLFDYGLNNINDITIQPKNITGLNGNIFSQIDISTIPNNQSFQMSFNQTIQTNDFFCCQLQYILNDYSFDIDSCIGGFIDTQCQICGYGTEREDKILKFMALQYYDIHSNSSNVNITVNDGNRQLFDGVVQNGDIFSFYGLRKQRKIGNRINIFIDSNRYRIESNCRNNNLLTIGDVFFNKFKLIDAILLNHNHIC